MTITIWHNPRCSSSRKTLELLHDNDIDPVIRHYLTNPPSIEEISEMQKLLKKPVASFIRTGEDVYKDLNLGNCSDQELLIAAISAHPILLQRPIVFTDEKAAIGRPPEAVLAILPNKNNS